MTFKTPRPHQKALINALGWTLLLSGAHAADWPQYLGPGRNSTSAEKGILRAWPTNGPAVLWTVPVGKGFGGPAIKDGNVYLLDRDEAVGDTLRCLDLANGKELWTFAYPAPGTAMFPGSRSVPTVDGTPAGTTAICIALT
jgi:outer membrane protein assembly factor BamB